MRLSEELEWITEQESEFEYHDFFSVELDEREVIERSQYCRILCSSESLGFSRGESNGHN